MGKKEKQAQPQRSEAYRAGKIRARIIDEKKGLQLLSGIGAVRVRSRDYSLLIMDDYMPALGKVEGMVSFLTEHDETAFPNIEGFYKHQHNEFTLLIQGELEAKRTDGETRT